MWLVISSRCRPAATRRCPEHPLATTATSAATPTSTASPDSPAAGLFSNVRSHVGLPTHHAAATPGHAQGAAAHGNDLDGSRTLLQRALSGGPGGGYGSGVADDALDPADELDARCRRGVVLGRGAGRSPAPGGAGGAASPRSTTAGPTPRALTRPGRRARMLLDGAREAVAAGLGARTEEVVVLPASHASALHAAVLGTLAARVRRRRRAGALRGRALRRAGRGGVAHHAGWTVRRDRASTAWGGSTWRLRGRGRPARRGGRPRCSRPTARWARVQPVDEVQAACRAAGVPLARRRGGGGGARRAAGRDRRARGRPRRLGRRPGGRACWWCAPATRWREPGPVLPADAGSSGHGASGARGARRCWRPRSSLQRVLADREAADARRRSAVEAAASACPVRGRRRRGRR